MDHAVDTSWHFRKGGRHYNASESPRGKKGRQKQTKTLKKEKKYKIGISSSRPRSSSASTALKDTLPQIEQQSFLHNMYAGKGNESSYHVDSSSKKTPYYEGSMYSQLPMPSTVEGTVQTPQKSKLLSQLGLLSHGFCNDNRVSIVPSLNSLG